MRTMQFVVQESDQFDPTDHNVSPRRRQNFLNLSMPAHIFREDAPLNDGPSIPVVFYKVQLSSECHVCSTISQPASSLIGPGVPVTIPRVAQPVAHHLPDYEVELTIVIGKTAKDVLESEALDYVLGYTVGNDVRNHPPTCRSIILTQNSLGVLQTPSISNKVRGLGLWVIDVDDASYSQWCWSKSFDETTPFGPVLVSARAIPDPQKLPLTAEVNGKVLQKGTTAYEIIDSAHNITWHFLLEIKYLM